MTYYDTCYLETKFWANLSTSHLLVLFFFAITEVEFGLLSCSLPTRLTFIPPPAVLLTREHPKPYRNAVAEGLQFSYSFVQ